MKRAKWSIHTGHAKYIEKGTIVPEDHPKYEEYLKRDLLEDVPVAKVAPVSGAEDEGKSEEPVVTLDDPIGNLAGVNKKVEALLIEAGIEKISNLDEFTVDDLVSIDGIGEATAGKLLDELDAVKAANPSKEG